MTLRNAFEGLATERTLRSLLRNLNLAKTSSDQLRVVVDSGAVNTTVYWANANTYPSWYSTGAATSMDAREQQAELSRANFHAVRNQRWSL